MSFDFPNAPTVGQAFGNYQWDGEKWVLPAGGSGVPPAPFYSAAYSGMQINGSFEVSQEKGANLAVAAGYICDGWNYAGTGTGVLTAGTTIPSIPFPGFIYRLIMSTSTAQASMAAGDRFNISQNIEGYRVARLGWGTSQAQPLTLGFWTRHIRTGIYSVAFRNNAANRSYVTTYTQDTTDTWEYKVVTVPGDTTGTWLVDNGVGLTVTFTLACGTTLTAPAANTWTAGNFIAAPGQVNAMASTSDSFRLTGVIVLPGIQAPTAAQSPLLMRPYDQELITCKRYWEKVRAYQVSYSIAGTSVVATTAPFSVEKRANPTQVLLATALNNCTLNTSSATTKQLDVVGNVTATGAYVLDATYTCDARL